MVRFSMPRKQPLTFKEFKSIYSRVPRLCVDLLIKTIWRVRKQIPAVKLVVAGVGEDEARLKKLVTSLKLESVVTFTGKVSESKKAELFTQSWVAIQPSMVEGWGIRKK